MTATRLQKYREELLMTRAELSQKSGLSISTINRIEQGKARPTLTTIRKILEVLGVPPSKRELVFPSKEKEYYYYKEE
ncbi:TPA: XRE family transcriptional regulator [bacterium]|nr:XRE family transcriptional regulator [bacterium]